MEAVSTSLKNGEASKQISLTVVGPSLQLFGKGKETSCLGMLKQPLAGVLRVVLTTFKLEFDTFVPDAMSITSDKSDLQVAVDLYCPLSQSSAVGDALSQKGIFLQDFYMNLRELRYKNPQVFELSAEALQYLKAEGIDISSVSELDGNSRGKLGETELVQRENEALKIFDETSEDPKIISHESPFCDQNISQKITTQLQQ